MGVHLRETLNLSRQAKVGVVTFVGACINFAWAHLLAQLSSGGNAFTVQD